MNVPREYITKRQAALTLIKAYRHPRSNRGIGQDTSMKFRILDRKLDQGLKDFVDQHNGLIKQHGIPKDKELPDGPWHVPTSCPGWSAFQEDARALREGCLEISDTLLIKLSELQVRDEADEWEEIDSGAIADLGELLEEPKEPEATPAAEPAATKPPKRAKKPRPE